MSTLSGLAASPALGSSGFGDVGATDYYAKGIQWLVEEGVTSGTSDGCFSPGDTLTRGQLAAFIWRYEGRPAGGSHPFVDVPAGLYYSDAVGWLYQSGLSAGVDARHYAPGDLITRAQVAAFLWRLAGKPSAPQSNFSDVVRGTYYAKAVDWLVTTGITLGTSPTTFSPERALTRGEFAAFLYRYDGSKPVVVRPGGTCLATGQFDRSTPPIYVNDFSSPTDENRIDQFVQYRDPYVVNNRTGSSDHASTGGADCTAPETTRPQLREYPVEHVYQCLPGGDPAAGHMMAYAMDTAGYGWAGALPDQVFTGVRMVSVDINATSYGNRNFVEIKVLPADSVHANGMPCVPDLPCNDGWDYDDVNGVAGSTQAPEGTGLTIGTPQRPDGYEFDDRAESAAGGGSSQYAQCPSQGHCFTVLLHEGNQDVRTRYTHVLVDNGDGTISFGIEREDGTFGWVTAPGSFPSGPARVVVAFHNYTGTKDGSGPERSLSNGSGGVTWHWDNLSVVADTAVDSETYFGGTSADRIVTPNGCIAFAQGMRNVHGNNDVAPRFQCPGDGPVG